MVLFTLFHNSRIYSQGVKYIFYFLKGEYIINSTRQILFPGFCLFGKTWPNKYSQGIRMQRLYHSCTGNHWGNRTRHVGNQLVINLTDHTDPHGAAAAGQLVIVSIVDVLIKFKSFL